MSAARGPVAHTVALARRAWRWERGVWVSLYRWLRRSDPSAHPEAERFTYVKAIEVILWGFIVVSAIEVPAAHLLIPWEPVRTIVLVLGIWGLLWMVGLLAAYTVHSHLVEPGGLRLRNGFAVDVTIPWEHIAGVATRERSRDGSRTVQLDEGQGEHEGAAVLHLVVGSRTNVDLRLHRPVSLDLPQGPTLVGEVRLLADEPKALAVRIRERTSGATAHTGPDVQR